MMSVRRIQILSLKETDSDYFKEYVAWDGICYGFNTICLSLLLIFGDFDHSYIRLAATAFCIFMLYSIVRILYVSLGSKCFFRAELEYEGIMWTEYYPILMLASIRYLMITVYLYLLCISILVAGVSMYTHPETRDSGVILVVFGVTALFSSIRYLWVYKYYTWSTSYKLDQLIHPANSENQAVK